MGRNELGTRVCTGFKLLVVLSIASALIGCGGGSSGTGGRDYAGYVERSNAQQGIQGVLVTIGGTQSSAITDESGYYQIHSDYDQAIVDYQIKINDIETTITVSEVPDDTLGIVADFVVNFESQEVELINLDFLDQPIIPEQDRDSSEEGNQPPIVAPGPQPTPAPGATPTPAPGVTPTPEPGATPTPDSPDSPSGDGEPTPDPTPSPTPTPTPTEGSGGGSSTTTICHVRQNGSTQTLVVNQSAVTAHLAHGDSLGPCP